MVPTEILKSLMSPTEAHNSTGAFGGLKVIGSITRSMISQKLTQR